MAESQASYTYTKSSTSELVRVISDPRFKPFRQKAGFQSDELAFEFYLYNARLAKSFMFPIHICEVALRNAVNRVFNEHYTTGWWRQPAFRDLLTSESRAGLDRAVDICKRKGKESADDIVPTLALDFWSNLFRPEYEALIWKRHWEELLPGSTASFEELGSRLRRITRLRNRIAHHESILHVNAQATLNEIHFVVAALSQDVLDWLKAHTTVHKVLRSRPPLRATTVKQRADPAFLSFPSTSKLHELTAPLTSPCLIRNEGGDVEAVINAHDIANHILSTAEDWCLLDFGELDLGAVAQATRDSVAFVMVHESEPAEDLPEYFKKGARYALVYGNTPQDVFGFVGKAHRRY